MLAIVAVLIAFIPGAAFSTLRVIAYPFRPAVHAWMDRKGREENKRIFADLQQYLLKKYGPPTPLQDLPTGTLQAGSQAKPWATGDLSAWPSVAEVMRVSLIVDVLDNPSDASATWILRVAREHPVPDARDWAAMGLCKMFNDGSNEMNISKVSDEKRGEVMLEIVRRLLYPDRSPLLVESKAMLGTSATYQLWRIPAIRDAMDQIRDRPEFLDDDGVRGWYKAMDKALNRSPK